MRKRKTKTEIHIRFSKRCENEIRSSKPFFKVSRKRKTKSKIQICFSMSCENEKWKWHLNSLFPCHRKTAGTKVHALFRVRSIGKSGFRFWKSGFRICNRTRNPKTDFNAEISVFGFSFLPFDWEIRKRICKTILVNSGLLLSMRARTRPLFLRTVFQILFRIFHSDFAFDCKSDIRILKSKFRFPNRTLGLYTFCSKKRLFCSKELPPKKAILLEIMLQKYYYARIMLL